MADFAVGYGFLRLAVLVVPSGFDLYHNERMVLFGHDVEVFFSVVPVCVPDEIPFFLQERNCRCFAFLSEFIMCCHIFLFGKNTYFCAMNQKDDLFYMKQALLEARRAADCGEVPVGAVVVCRGVVLARAHNLTEALNDVTAHAEMQAITAAANALGAKYLTECTLYVTVEPCVMCAGAIAWAQTGRLVFGAADEKRGYRRYAPDALHPKTEVVDGVMAEECAALVKDFFRKRR